MVDLDSDSLIGEGHSRYCYAHPTDFDKVIKIKKKHKVGRRDPNVIEYIYLKKLFSDDFKYMLHIAPCFGWVDTSEGTGLMFQRIYNYDSSTSKSLSEVIHNKLLPKSVLDKIVADLRKFVFKEHILFYDANCSNVLVQEVSKNHYRLVIIDGIGARKNGFKYWFRRHFSRISMVKVRHEWDSFMREYHSVLSNAAPASSKH